MSRPQKPDPDKPLIPGSNHTPALAFATILTRLHVVVEMWKSLKGFTYSPKSDLVFDAYNRHEALALFLELIRGSRDFLVDRPIYLIAVTCHSSTEIDDDLRKGYEKIARGSNQPLIGYWKDYLDWTHLDAVVATQFNNKKDAMRIGKRYGQKYILAIWPDGGYEHIEAD
ncbi:MAG: hypothetical protein EB830_01060 [Nitrosopumilus sp. H13]|nr:MAG: hypothetical protein EB830_01060 [Nitrosopumilus sp. H13]